MYGKKPYIVHMGASVKNSRIELRVTSAQKLAIEMAAAIEGRTVSDFSMNLLVDHAELVIQRDRQLQVSAEQFEAFVAILDQPAKEIPQLRRLLSRQTVFVD